MASTSGTRFRIPTADLPSELAEAGYTQVGLSVSYCELFAGRFPFDMGLPILRLKEPVR